MTHYFDTSALVKLIVEEPESAALRAWVAENGQLPLSSDLVRTELRRTARRHGDDHVRAAEGLLDAIELQVLARGIFDLAGQVDPLLLRSLDAIHLACALSLEDDLESIVTYDSRLAEAAAAHGVPVSAPA